MGNSEQPNRTAVLWAQFSSHVRAFVRSRVSNENDVDDIVQDIFIRIHEGIGSLRHEDRVQSWVFTIARRALADYYRRQKRDREQPAEGMGTAQAGEGPAPDLNEFEGEHGVHEEVMSWLIPMIGELPDKYGIPLRMADVKGKTQQEVADQLGLSLPGAKSRIQRARQKLGEVLAACCEVEFGEEGRAVAYRKLPQENDPCEEC